MSLTFHRLGPTDTALLRDLNALFADVFEDAESYVSAPPGDAYVAAALTKEHIAALVAVENGVVVGGLVAYALDKLEQARSEFYIYDLAVRATHRRQGIATALIEKLREIAATRGTWVIYVQADYGDELAIALYEKLGTREDVMHFDIAVKRVPS
jgi:aminoglycoside 3-N-acetyltransferase I